MKWSTLIERVADRAEVKPKVARRVLTALTAVALEALIEGDTVPIRGLVSLGSRWSASRTLRSVSSRRRMLLDGRFVVRYTTSSRLKRALAERTPQHWRDPEHQNAWRVAETLVGDLALYQASRAPKDLSPSARMEEVSEVCRRAFGPLWVQVESSYAERVPAEVRAAKDYLGLAARETWGAESAE